MLSLVAGLSWVLACAGQVAIVVIIATVVRRNRPDVYGKLLLWAALALGFNVLGLVVRPVLSIFAMQGGVDKVILVQTASTAINIPIHLALVVLLARGLIAIAQPAKPPIVEGMPPYR